MESDGDDSTLLKDLLYKDRWQVLYITRRYEFSFGSLCRIGIDVTSSLYLIGNLCRVEAEERLTARKVQSKSRMDVRFLLAREGNRPYDLVSFVIYLVTKNAPARQGKASSNNCRQTLSKLHFLKILANRLYNPQVKIERQQPDKAKPAIQQEVVLWNLKLPPF